MATQVYQLPVLYNNPPIYPAESVYQAVEVIAQLNSIVDEVFGKIRAKIEREKTRLDAIGCRIQAANDKTSYIQRNKSLKTVVTSPSIYPAPTNLLCNTPAIIPTETPKSPQFSQYPRKLRLENLKIPEPTPLFKPQEDLSAFSLTDQNSYPMPVFRELRTVDSLVPFNTKEKRTKAPQQISVESVTPFVLEDQIPNPKGEAISYNPAFGENFPLPSTLPQVLSMPGGNVALDIEPKQFFPEISPIAPTMFLGLPEINQVPSTSLPPPPSPFDPMPDQGPPPPPEDIQSVPLQPKLPVSQPQIQPVPQQQKLPVSQTQIPVSQTQTPVSQQQKLPVSQSQTQPVSQQPKLPVSQSQTQPVSQSQTQPVSQSQTQPVSQSQKPTTTLDTKQENVKSIPPPPPPPPKPYEQPPSRIVRRPPRINREPPPEDRSSLFDQLTRIIEGRRIDIDGDQEGVADESEWDT